MDRDKIAIDLDGDELESVIANGILLALTRFTAWLLVVLACGNFIRNAIDSWRGSANDDQSAYSTYDPDLSHQKTLFQPVAPANSHSDTF